MKAPLELSFLWHMHQPDYRDTQGIIQMPWVFLHAIKDYYDMPWMLSKFPDLKASFNLTAPLIEQLKLYADPLKNDYFLMLWHQDPEALSTQEKKWMIKICKSANYDNMIKPLPRYAELYEKEEMSKEELIDLEILFLLSWCGPYLRLNNSLIQTLLKQKRAYTANNKQMLLEVLVTFIAGILPFYASLLRSGQIALSTTPYNHPILPLLIDMENVLHANPYIKIPDNHLSLKEDAVEQVKRAIILYKETFGQMPVGFWPAEGAVDEESVEIYKSMGIKWIATDEAILFKSLGNHERSSLFRPYNIRGLNIYFRDHALSDLFGFNYRFKPFDKAVRHFMSEIFALVSEEKKSLFVILDGENAWEYYQENAYPFFMKLYENILKNPWCETVTMDEIAKEESTALYRLASGSWICGDFSTWVGHPEKNKAWELLFQAKRDMLGYTIPLSSEVAEKIKLHFLAAQSSDWFWWYGDDHSTDFALEFDTLFRHHLISIYELLGIQVPRDLFTPIIENKGTVSFLLKPQSYIYPQINGKIDSFFEWIGCGRVDENRIFSTMDKVRGSVEKIRFGHNETMVFIAFEGDIESLKKATLVLIIKELSKTIRLPLDQSGQIDEVCIQIDTIIEMALPRKVFESMQLVHLRFEIEEEGRIIQVLPGFGALEMNLNEDYTKNWYV